MQETTQIRQQYAVKNSSSSVVCKSTSNSSPVCNKQLKIFSSVQKINQNSDPYALNKSNSPEVSNKIKQSCDEYVHNIN
jgi:uncharacterized protein with ATP-grasp and redox domains